MLALHRRPLRTAIAERPRRATAAALLAYVVTNATGCIVDGGEPPSPIPYDAGGSEQAYPTGPYGISVGSVISNFVFEGYARPANGLGTAARSPIALADFYNPTGDGHYPEGSPFGADEPLPRALMINVSAVWCVACQREASEVLPAEYARIRPLGGELLLDLAEASELGVVAGYSQLDNWVRAFDVDYPAVVDPTYQLGALFDSSAFPANILVDTRDMSIVDSVSGVPEESFWNRMDTLLAAP